MKKAILLSVKPQYLKKILEGEKTIEIRKTIPKCELPVDVYLYCTKEKNKFDKIEKQDGEYYYGDPCYTGLEIKLNGKVVAKFTLKEVDKYIAEFVDNNCYEGIRYVYLNEDGEEEDKVIFTNEIPDDELNIWEFPNSCVKYKELKEYVGTNFFSKPFYAWHINNLETFDNPMELSDFYKTNALSYDNWLYGLYNGTSEYSYKQYLMGFQLRKVPQSWQYVYVKE